MESLNHAFSWYYFLILGQRILNMCFWDNLLIRLPSSENIMSLMSSRRKYSRRQLTAVGHKITRTLSPRKLLKDNIVASIFQATYLLNTHQILMRFRHTRLDAYDSTWDRKNGRWHTTNSSSELHFSSKLR